MATNSQQSPSKVSLSKTESEMRRMSLESTYSYMIPTGPRKMFLPVDGSDNSERAVEWFLDNVYKPTDIVILSCVIEPPQFPPGQSDSRSSIVQDGNKLYDEGKKQAAKTKLKFLTQLDLAGVPSSNAEFKELLGTKPGETLIKFITEERVNCVIIGSRGLGKLKRTFLGSVSDYILHNANCPVIICPKVKKNKKNKEEKSK